MYSHLTFLLAIGFAASISLPTGQYKYESQVLTRAPQGDLTAAGLRFTADVLIAPLNEADSYLVHFQHVHLSSLGGISPSSSWSKIIHDEYWTIHKYSSCKNDLCSLTKPFIIRVKEGVVQDVVVEESELQLSVNIKKGFAWEYQKLMLQENIVYQQLPTHYGYCDLRTILKSNATSEQFSKPIKKIHIAPVRGTCSRYPTNTDSIINEVKSTAEVMDGKVYNLYTVQSIQLRISKMDKTKFITQVNQTLSYQGSRTTELPPVNATIPYELVPTIDEDKIGGDKFVQKVLNLLLSFTQNLTSDHGRKSIDLIHLLRVADKTSLMKLYALVKEQPKNWTTLYSFLSVAESCEANDVLFLAMEENSISRAVLPEILERQYQNTKRCPNLVSELKKIIDSQIWDKDMVEKAYMVLSSLVTKYPEYIPEVWPIIEQLMSIEPRLALKMAGNLGQVMRLFPQVQTREQKILVLETLRHSNESDVRKALIESFKMFENCSEHEEIRMLALKTYLYLSPINESWTSIKVVQRKDCSLNIRSYIEDILAVTANRNFPTEKPMAKKACDLQNMLNLLTQRRSLLNLNVSRAFRLPFYCEKSNMGVALQAEMIHSSPVTDLPEDRLTILTLKVDTFGLDKKMEPLEIQLMLPTEVLKRIVQLPTQIQKPQILEEVYKILSKIEIRIFIQNVEYSSLPNVQEAVRRVYERYLVLQQSGINQVAVPVHAVYRLPTSLGVVLSKQLTVFVIARAYRSLSVDPVQRVLESLPIVVTSAEIKVSVENAFMSLKTGSRVDASSDLRVLDTTLKVTENRIRIVKKLSRWEDKSIFYARVTPFTSIQVFRPSGYFVAFNSLSVQTPARRSYIKSLIGLKRPEILLETTGYVEAESVVRPWTSLFREQYLMVDMHFKRGSDEDLVIDLQRRPEYLKAKKLGEQQRISEHLNISVSRGLDISKVLINVSQERNWLVGITSNVSLLSATDVGIWEAKFEIEIPSKIEPECILNQEYLIGQLLQKPWSSLFSQFTSNQTQYPHSYQRLLDIIGWAVSYEEMWHNYDNMFSEVMPKYIFKDTLQWPSVYELVKSVNILSEKVKQLKLNITTNCSEEQKQVVVSILEELQKMKTQVEQVLKEPVQEGVPLELLMRREVVVNWLLQKYAGLLFHISIKVNRSEELLAETLQVYSKFVTETIPIWQDNSKRYSSAIQKVSQTVSVDLQNLVQKTTDYMQSSFKIMNDATKVDKVELLYKTLIENMTEITRLIQLRSLGDKVNPYLWIRSQSAIVLQNVADISVYLLNQQPLMKSLSQVVRTSKSNTFRLYFTTLYLEKLWNGTRYIQNTTLYSKISELANRTLETIYGMQNIEMHMKLSVVNITHIDSVVNNSRRVIAASEKVLKVLKEIDFSSLENPLSYVSIFDILSIQYHAYVRVKNAAKVVYEIVHEEQQNKNLNEIIKLQQKLDSYYDRIPKMSKIISLKSSSLESECPVGQRVQILGSIKWPTHDLTVNVVANLTKSWEQIIWEILQMLPLSKSVTTYKWLRDVTHGRPDSLARLQIFGRVNAYEEFQIETYVKEGEVPRSWVEASSKVFDKVHHSLFPFFTLKAVTLESPVVKDSCRGVCIQGAVSDRNSLVNAVFRLPRAVYTTNVPWTVLAPLRMKTCLY